MSLKPPQFLSDLYRDLRDRHLLLPAVALLAALVAVPVLLSRSAETAPPPAPAASDEGIAISPAVLADQQVGVRDYRKRLDRLQSKNPFTQQFTSVPKSAELNGISSGGSPTLSGTSGSTAPTTSSSSSSTSTTTSTTSTTPIAPPPPKPTTSGSGNTAPRWFVWKVDVRVGPAGDVKARDNVSKGTPLPGIAKPIATFLVVLDSGDQAVFSLSRDATVADTDGSCRPAPDDCQYLVLKEGESAKLDYADERYHLKLVDVHLVPVKRPAKDKAGVEDRGDTRLAR